jgi:hypothetical protein
MVQIPRSLGLELGFSKRQSMSTPAEICIGDPSQVVCDAVNCCPESTTCGQEAGEVICNSIRGGCAGGGDPGVGGSGGGGGGGGGCSAYVLFVTC